MGRDVYLALAAVGWADGRLTREAADAIVRTALEEGLDLEDIAAIEDATKQPVELGEIDRMKMSKADRLVWLEDGQVRMLGVRTPEKWVVVDERRRARPAQATAAQQ